MAIFKLDKATNSFIPIKFGKQFENIKSDESILAPIALFVYNRTEETRRTLESLMINELAKDSEIHIYSDGPKNISDNQKVESVRKLLKSIKYTFQSVYITERKENFGLAKSIITGATEIIQHYGKIICLEDDLVSSSNFLAFSNQALNYYNPNKKVFSISGYSFPLKFENNQVSDVYFTRRASSLGWATWKDRWENIDWEIIDYPDFVRNKKSQRDFNKGGQDLTRMLKKQMKGEINSWAIRWCYNQFKSKQISVYAKKSKIEHIGFGSTATNLNKYDLFQTQLDGGEKLSFNFPEVAKIDKAIEKQFTYKFSYLNKAKEKIRSLFSNGAPAQ